jgi:threonine dehydrogenase-like Zn-dependent dehydrogenase
MALNQTIRQSGEKVVIQTPEETPHACMGGWVFLGFEDEDENGDHVEVIERVPCKRCKQAKEGR